MTLDEQRVWEHSRAGWGFTLDLEQVPDYARLTLRGKASESRNRALLDLIQETLPLSTDEEGIFYPWIIDLRHSGQPSMANLRLGLEIVQAFGAWLLYAVVIVDPHRRDTTLIRHMIAIVEKLTAGQRLAVATSLEEALDKVRSFHDRYEKTG